MNLVDPKPIPRTTEEDASHAQDDVWIPSSCSLCYGSCSILAHRVDGVIVKIEGNPNDPNSRGHLCARGQAGLNHLYHPERLLYPLRRVHQSLPGVRAAGWSRIWHGVPRADRYRTGTTAHWPRQGWYADLGVHAVRRLWRGLPGAHPVAETDQPAACRGRRRPAQRRGTARARQSAQVG